MAELERLDERDHLAARLWWGGTLGAFVLALCFALGGAGGVLLLLVVLAVGTAVIGPLTLPRARRPRGRGSRPVPMVDAAFPDFRRIAEALSWAAVSPRHYDVVTRPVLQRLLAGRLAERHGLDLHRDADRARMLVGEDLWPMLDPARPARETSAPPGIDRSVVARIVERLEAL